MSNLSKDQLAEALSTTTLGLGEFVDQTLVITGFRLADGSYGEYAIIDAVTASGDEVAITSGGAVIVPQLKKLAELDAFPQELRVASFPTKYGKLGYKFEVS